MGTQHLMLPSAKPLACYMVYKALAPTPTWQVLSTSTKYAPCLDLRGSLSSEGLYLPGIVMPRANPSLLTLGLQKPLSPGTVFLFPDP